MHQFTSASLLHIALTLLFLWVAALQLNDPDPLFWCLLYLFTATVPLMAFFHIPAEKQAPVLALACGFCLAGFILVLPGASEYLNHISQESLVQDMSPEKPYIEEARELIGTAVALAAIITYWILNKRKITQPD